MPPGYNLPDIACESPDREYLAVFYERREVRMGWETAQLTVLGGSHDNPAIVFQNENLRCMAFISYSLQWLAGGRYLATKAHLYNNAYEYPLQVPFLFFDLHDMKFAFYPVMHAVMASIHESGERWIIKAHERDARFKSHHDETIIRDALNWHAVSSLDDYVIKYFDGYYGLAE